MRHDESDFGPSEARVWTERTLRWCQGGATFPERRSWPHICFVLRKRCDMPVGIRCLSLKNHNTDIYLVSPRGRGCLHRSPQPDGGWKTSHSLGSLSLCSGGLSVMPQSHVVTLTWSQPFEHFWCDLLTQRNCSSRPSNRSCCREESCRPFFHAFLFQVLHVHDPRVLQGLLFPFISQAFSSSRCKRFPP
jgi:hypothetical protein